jgi:hypothetical protein
MKVLCNESYDDHDNEEIKFERNGFFNGEEEEEYEIPIINKTERKKDL